MRRYPCRRYLSPATLRGYRYDLRHFSRWYQGLQDAPFEPGRLAGYELSGIVKLTPLEMTLDNIRRVESLPGPALLSSSLTWAAGNC